MMSDLVKRLREWETTHVLIGEPLIQSDINEAADEIERLEQSIGYTLDKYDTVLDKMKAVVDAARTLAGPHYSTDKAFEALRKALKELDNEPNS